LATTACNKAYSCSYTQTLGQICINRTNILEIAVLDMLGKKHGSLYLVGTPIGNLGDMVPRAIEVLQSVDCIAAEDTRRAGQLLGHFSVRTPTLAYHDHNESQASINILTKIKAGQSVALISDAGMPLISDPGYSLVRLARQENIEVIAVPGPSAGILALSASGLPTDQFSFVGFPPAKTVARKKWYESLANKRETLILYESPHRILESLKDARLMLEDDREVSIVRELTKKFETWYIGNLSEIIGRLESEDHAQKGEFVVVLRGAPEMVRADAEISRLMLLAIPDLGVKKAAVLVSEILGVKKNRCYQVGLDSQED
jgi:16S rRNA (cytidine1402-2'-O)-methyltransferase